jgi:hypothetical protein
VYETSVDANETSAKALPILAENRQLVIAAVAKVKMHIFRIFLILIFISFSTTGCATFNTCAALLTYF